MDKFVEEPKIELMDSHLDLPVLLEILECGDELKEQIGRALIVLLPTDLSPEVETHAFPDSSREIFRYFRAQMTVASAIEAPVTDDNYREFALLSDSIILPSLYVASNTVLTLAINLLGSFLFDKLKARGELNSDNTVESEIHFRDTKGNMQLLKYQGPADTYEKVATEFLKKTGHSGKGSSSLND